MHLQKISLWNWFKYRRIREEKAAWDVGENSATAVRTFSGGEATSMAEEKISELEKVGFIWALSMTLKSEMSDELSKGEPFGCGTPIVDVGDRGQFQHNFVP